MAYVTKNILNFYNKNKANSWYFKKFFTNTDNLGYYLPYAKDAVLTNSQAMKLSHKVIPTVDDHTEYNVNAFGFRGEIDKDADVLGVGCSMTFGLGVPESGRWTNILSSQINQNIMNLGSPGASVETVCLNIIQYCSNNKMPKEIFCLFPDFFRRMVVEDPEFYKSKRSPSIVEGDLGFTFCNPEVYVHKDEVLMAIEDKTYIEDYTSPHQLILNSVNLIYILESFCSLNEIKLYWTTWDIPTSVIMNTLIQNKDFKLKNFRSFYPPDERDGAGKFVRKNCNSDHNSEFKDDIRWDKGSDYSIIKGKKVVEYAHPGIHFHQHVSDFFYKLYKENHK